MQFVLILLLHFLGRETTVKPFISTIHVCLMTYYTESFEPDSIMEDLIWRFTKSPVDLTAVLVCHRIDTTQTQTTNPKGVLRSYTHREDVTFLKPT